MVCLWFPPGSWTVILPVILMALRPLLAWAGSNRSKCTPWVGSCCGGRRREGARFTSVSRPHPSNQHLLQWLLIFIMSACVHAQSLPSCLSLCNPMDCSLPGSSIRGILQARVLQWVAMPSSRDRTHVFYISCIAGRLFTHWATWEALSFIIWILDSFHKQKEPGYLPSLGDLPKESSYICI